MKEKNAINIEALNILNEEEQNIVIEDLKKGININENRSKLIESNLILVVKISNKYDDYFQYKEDIISIGTLGLIKSIDTFKTGNKGKFKEHIKKGIENEIIAFLTKVGVKI